MLDNYTTVVEGKIAASACPGRSGNLAADLERLKKDDITAIVSLTETCLDANQVTGAGMLCRHIPVVDFGPPSLAQMKEFTDFVRAYTAESRGAVLVHCGAGIGRTGTMLCAWFISEGMTTDQAVEHVRKLRPGSVETPSQIAALRQFEKLNSKPPDA